MPPRDTGLGDKDSPSRSLIYLGHFLPSFFPSFRRCRSSSASKAFPILRPDYFTPNVSCLKQEPFESAAPPPSLSLSLRVYYGAGIIEEHGRGRAHVHGNAVTKTTRASLAREESTSRTSPSRAACLQ